MKKIKLTSTLYFVGSVLSYIVAIIKFTGEDQITTAITWLCIGSAMLCLGFAALKMKKDNQDKGE